MAKFRDKSQSAGSYIKGSDAAYIEPRLIPDYELLPRDDSGGPEFDPYNAQFGDGGFVTGDKAHLSARGGKDDGTEGDEETDNERAVPASKALGQAHLNPKGPAKSAKLSKSRS